MPQEIIGKLKVISIELDRNVVERRLHICFAHFKFERVPIAQTNSLTIYVWL
jgi:hypothetical protein